MLAFSERAVDKLFSAISKKRNRMLRESKKYEAGTDASKLESLIAILSPERREVAIKYPSKAGPVNFISVVTACACIFE